MSGTPSADFDHQATTVLLFESNNAALWGEDIALEEGIAVRVVSAPAESNAKCDMALEILSADLELFLDALRADNLTCEVWPPRD